MLCFVFKLRLYASFEHWLDILADLILDSAAAGQLVAVTDGDYDGRLKEKRIPSLQRWKKKTHLQIILKPIHKCKEKQCVRIKSAKYI